MKKFLAVILTFLAAAAFSHLTAATEQVRIPSIPGEQKVLLPASAPDKSRFTVLDDVPFEDEDVGLGTLVFYDDPRTRLRIDYIECYDAAGNLLVVSWVDRYGICHIAMDRGLLNEWNPKPERVLVAIPSGTEL